MFIRLYMSLTLAALITLPTMAQTVDQPEARRLAEAVKFKTISYQDRDLIVYEEFERLRAFLSSSFPRAFSSLSTELVNEHSLLMTWGGSDQKRKPILFTAHFDVVPVEPGTEKDWAYPAFAGVVADGRIYGRGTLDDKNGVLSLLEAVESLLAEGFTPKRSVVFAFGHDEEIGGRHGAKNLAKVMRDRGMQFAWMVDEGGLVIRDNPLLPDRPLAMINVAEKGYLTLTLTATGEGGHSSRPPVVSTIGRLSSALAKIEANPFPVRLIGPVEAMLERLAPYASQPERFVFNNLWLTGGMVAKQMARDQTTNSFVRTTTALTMVNAGVKENVIPQSAQAKVNFRLLPGDTQDSIVERITEIVDDPEIEITYDRWDNLPEIADHEAEGFAVIAQAVNSVFPEALVVPSLLTATTDTRHYIDLADDQYRFHGVEMVTAQANSIHGTNEYVDISSYLRSIEVAKLMITHGAQ
ncbi:MAG: M20/M25/M40 family metallo-hydrolase [Halioglobus sp.]